MSKKVVILGAGGLARDVVDIFQAMSESGEEKYEVLGYVVDSRYGTPGTIIYGKPILGDVNWLEPRVKEVRVISAVGASETRQEMSKRAALIGADFINAIHPKAVLSPSVILGSGVVIKAGCLLASEVCLGNQVVLNLGCTIGHNTKIEDFVTVAAGVNIAGYVKIGRGCHLGLGCKIIEKLEIGDWAFIASGSVVTKNISSYTTVAGVPARPIKTHQPYFLDNKD